MPANKYHGEETDQKAFRLALLGLTDEQMAAALDISTTSYYNWKDPKHKHFKRSFVESLRNAKDDADAKVFACMYQRAIGYDKEIRLTKVMDDGTEVEYLDDIKHFPPDVAAQKHFLANRRKMKFNYDGDKALDTISELLKNININRTVVKPDDEPSK